MKQRWGSTDALGKCEIARAEEKQGEAGPLPGERRRSLLYHSARCAPCLFTAHLFLRWAVVSLIECASTEIMCDIVACVNRTCSERRLTRSPEEAVPFKLVRFANCQRTRARYACRVHLKQWIILGGVVALPSCMVYDSELLNSAIGGSDEGSGGSSGGGDNTGDGDTEDSSGGMGADGGDPGDGDGDGDGDPSGGNGSGGRASGGAPSGGGSSDGGTGGQPAGGGGGGSGGGPPECSPSTAPCVVDDLEHVNSASYSSLPFRGTWSRYIEEDGVFTATSMAKMIVEESAEDDNGVLHVQATGLTEWGVGVFLTIKGGSFQDLSGYTGIRFRARSMNDETAINVALADDVSHTPACQSVAGGADCDHHMRSSDAPTFALSSDWTTLELPLNAFVDSADTPARTTPINLQKIYAIHFQIDTEGEEADYYIDDIVMY